ncbi:hypothetical protein OGAPHI_001008 [Ogataea philodendri]|uniref:Uncharacterized protein n=1 Tax=Ogataea philodendri TaxID=1378263 RepID=A0A9P8PDY4_9ASCO|nr:uncharacterized protein OGAPHI_001008 [Ogataea philodendri]KAH3670493.1 hypothetical protein OGAPHI_001008 [Ogataea philodendri]
MSRRPQFSRRDLDSDDEDGYSTDSSTSSLASISFEALSAAKKRIAQEDQEHSSDDQSEGEFFEPERTRDVARKKKSKHAPKEASSKKPVSKVREIPGLLEGTKYASSKHHDIRFDSAFDSGPGIHSQEHQVETGRVEEQRHGETGGEGLQEADRIRLCETERQTETGAGCPVQQHEGKTTGEGDGAETEEEVRKRDAPIRKELQQRPLEYDDRLLMIPYLVFQNGQVSGHHNVLENGAVGDVDPLTLGANNNNRTLQLHALAEINVTGNRKVVQFEDSWHVRDSLLEVGHFLEVGAELDEWGAAKTGTVEVQSAVLQVKQVALHQHQVRRVSNADTLGVWNDLHLQCVGLDQTLDGWQVDPQVVGVEVGELLDRLELLGVVLWNLSDLQQSHLSVVVDQSTSLNVGSGLVGQLHNVFCSCFKHVVEDLGVDGGTQVVSVGNKQDLLTLLKQNVQLSRGNKRLEQVTVSRWVPSIELVVVRLWNREQRVLEHSWVPGLVESSDPNTVALVLSHNDLCVVVGVERVHQKKWDIGVVGGVEVFDLTNRKIKERLAVSDLNDGLRTNTSHRRVGERIWFQSSVVPDALSVRYRLNKAKKESISTSNFALASGSSTPSIILLREFLICDAATLVLVFSKAYVLWDLACLLISANLIKKIVFLVNYKHPYTTLHVPRVTARDDGLQGGNRAPLVPDVVGGAEGVLNGVDKRLDVEVGVDVRHQFCPARTIYGESQLDSGVCLFGQSAGHKPRDKTLLSADDECAPVMDTDTIRFDSSSEFEASNGSNSSAGLTEMITVDWFGSCFQIGWTIIGGLELLSMVCHEVRQRTSRRQVQFDLGRDLFGVFVQNVTESHFSNHIGSGQLTVLKGSVVYFHHRGIQTRLCQARMVNLATRESAIACISFRKQGGAGGIWRNLSLFQSATKSADSALLRRSRCGSVRKSWTGTRFWNSSGAVVGAVPEDGNANELVEPRYDGWIDELVVSSLATELDRFVGCIVG